MSILKVKIRNFKNLSKIDQNLDGKSIFLIGDNEVGKSSFIQAVFNLLEAKFTGADYLKDGEEHGYVEAEFEANGKKYTARQVFTKGKSTFELQTDDGFLSTKKSVIRELVGNVSFNPFDFVELSKSAEGRRKQVEIIRATMPESVNEKISDYDEAYMTAYDYRTEKNREVNRLKTVLARYELSQEDFELERVDTMEIFEELDFISKVDKERARLDSLLDLHQNKIDEMEQQIKQLQKEKENRQEQLKKTQKESRDLPEVDTKRKEELENRLDTADEINEKVRQVEKYKKDEEEYLAAQKEVKRTEEEMVKIKSERKKIVSQNIVINDIDFEEEILLYKGKVLSLETFSTSEIMELGVKLQTTLNPKLKVLAIPRGESLGSDKLKSVLDFAKKNKYQLFIEKVDGEEKELTIKFIEDEK